MRVAVVQMAPILGHPDESMDVASRLLAPFSLDDGLHAVLLPEMAFSGYTFKNRESVAPMLEIADDGPTFAWCQMHARRLRCSVVCGFPRRHTQEGGVEQAFNSVMVVGPQGELVAVYDKHHLFETDKTWADEGSSFSCIELPNLPGVKVGLGICMDINPYEFKAPFDAYEFANFHKQAGSEVILFSSAWCNAHPDDTLETKMKEPDVGATIDYWGMRLFPLLGTDVTFVVADRVGSESCEPLGRPGSIIFCGGSCFIQLKQGELVGELDYHEEAVLVRDIALSIKPRLSHAQEAVTV